MPCEQRQVDAGEVQRADQAGQPQQRVVALGAQLGARRRRTARRASRDASARAATSGTSSVSRSSSSRIRGRAGGVVDPVAEDVVVVAAARAPNAPAITTIWLWAPRCSAPCTAGYFAFSASWPPIRCGRDVGDVAGAPHVRQRAGQLERQRLRRVRRGCRRPARTARRRRRAGRRVRPSVPRGTSARPGGVGDQRAPAPARPHRLARGSRPLRVDRQVHGAATGAALGQRRAGGADGDQPGSRGAAPRRPRRASPRCSPEQDTATTRSSGPTQPGSR